MKKYITLLAILLVALCGVVLYLFYRMGASDAKALSDFPVAYKNYDQAISEYSKAVLATPAGSPTNTGDLERKADEALAALDTKASVRISSLTKNDGVLMSVSHEIADLARKELETLKAYQSSAANRAADLDQLANQFRALISQRQADYIRYLELSGINNGSS